MTDTYCEMAQILKANKRTVSGCVFTQITDVENECDGMYNMDRTSKFTPAQLASIVAANTDLIHGSCSAGWQKPLNGFLADGGDAIPPAAATLADAQATCVSTDGCVGITFMANSSAPDGVIPRVYYKNQTSFSQSSEWWAYTLCV
jgi:hypothetical protein